MRLQTISPSDRAAYRFIVLGAVPRATSFQPRAAASAMVLRVASTPIRYENLDGGSELFPHIYGPMPREAIVAAEALIVRDDGSFDPLTVERCMTRAR